MFMLGMLKTILKTMLKYEKKTITLYGSVETERQISFFSFGLHELLKRDIYFCAGNTS